MSNSTSEIRLAKTPKEYKDRTRRAEDLCDNLTRHGEAESANWLFELMEMVGDVRTSASDREGLWGDIMRRIFPYTDSGQTALEAAILEINPNLAKWAASIRRAA